MLARLPLLLAAAVTFTLGNAGLASASWSMSGAGTSGARAAVLAPPTGLTVTGQSCTPTYSGTTTISYRDGAIATGAGTVAVSRPAGTVAGDLLVAAYTIRDDTASIITPPAGWTQVRFDLYATKNLQTGIWYRTATAGDPSTWTWTSTVTTVQAIGAIAAYSGAAGVDTSSGSKQTGASVIATTVTPAAAGSRLIGVFSENNVNTMTAPPGMTTRLQTSTSGSLVTLQLDDEGLYSASATGSRTATLSGSRDNIGQLVVLSPTVAPTTSTISYIGDTEGFGTNSFTVAAPAGIQVGDVMLIGYGKRKTAPTVTTPTGWTLLRREFYTGTDYQQIIYYRVATSADTAGTTYTLASSSADKADAILVAYRGVDQSNPIVTSSGGANAGDQLITAPSITPTRADTRLVGFFGSSDGNAVATNAAGMTSRQYVATGVGGGADVNLEVQDQPWPTASTATGTRTVTMNGNGRAVGHLVALKAESYPLASLSWTETTSTYAGGYRLGREVAGTETVATELTPRTLTSYTVGNTNRLTGGVSYTMNLKTRATNWLSTAASVTFTAQTTC